MLNGKQRARLRSMANGIPAAAQVGKNGVTPELVSSLDETLEARELVKISVLPNCDEETGAIADTLSGRTRSDVVQVIGKKIILYRRSKDKPAIRLRGE